jgi:DNA end-binding protein Ku
MILANLAPMAARSIWKGSISFGLVNIPIKLYSATEGKEFSFNQLCEKGHRIQYKRWCPVEEREVSWNEIQKGYEISKDRYVLLRKDDFEKIKIKTTKTIDIKEFIESEQLDPIFVEKSFYVAPDTKTVDKAYILFVKVLNATKKVAIGKVVLREKEHLVAVRAYQRGLVMHQIHYIDEIRPVDEIKGMQNTSKDAKVAEEEVSLAKTLVDNLTSDSFDPSKYSDAYANQLEKLINAKAEGKTHVAKEPEAEAAAGEDLLEALKASVRKSKSK